MPVTGEMVRTQLRLAGRSAKVLARHPRVGRELPRLAATRGRSVAQRHQKASTASEAG